GYACGTPAHVAAFDSGSWLSSPICSRPDRLAPARQQLPDAAVTRGTQRATRSRCPSPRRRCQTRLFGGAQVYSGVSIPQLSTFVGLALGGSHKIVRNGLPIGKRIQLNYAKPS